MTFPSPSTYPGPVLFPDGRVLIPNYPILAVQIEFVPGTWTTLPYVSQASGGRGRAYELATPQAGTMRITVDCSDGALDPTNTASPHYPNVKLNKRARVLVTWAGITKAIFTGYIERYPQRWEFGGQYQFTDLVVVDAFAPLGKTTLKTVAYQEFEQWLPHAWWALDDAAGSTAAGSQVGGRPLTTLSTRATGSTANGPFFGFGATQGAPGAPAPGMEGTSGAGFTPGPGALNTSPADMTVLRSPAGENPLPATGPWTVYCSWESAAPSMASIGAINGCRVLVLNSYDGNAYIAFGVDRTDRTALYMIDSAGRSIGDTTVTYSAPTYSLPDQGTWNNGIAHYSAASLSADHKTFYFTYSDVGAYASITKNDGTVWDFSTITSFSVGGEFRPNQNGNFAYNAWTGVVNNVAIFYSELMSTGALNDIATAEVLGYYGEDTFSRFSRLVGYWRPIAIRGSGGGNSSVQAPKIKGKSIATAISDVATDEFGTLYIDGDGQITFMNRLSRINPTSAFTFTDTGADGVGVLRYTHLTTDFDDTYLLNDVTVKRNNGVTARSADASSISDNGTYSTTVTTNIVDDQQAIDRAAYTVGRYAQPLPRIAGIELSPGTDPTLWPMVTSLDLNQAVTVVRTPGMGHGFTRVCWVEQIDYSMDASTGSFTMTLRLSPADVNSYLVLDDPVRGKLDSGNKLGY